MPIYRNLVSSLFPTLANSSLQFREMPSSVARPSSPRPSRISDILTHKFRLSSDAGRRLGLAEVRERMLTAEFHAEVPMLPEEGVAADDYMEVEGELRDIHNRYLRCAKSVEDATLQTSQIDATTSDPAVREETRLNLLELKEKLFQLKCQRARAESELRNHAGYGLGRSVLLELLEAERDIDTFRKDLEELKTEHDLAVATLRSYRDHTTLRLSSRTISPRNSNTDETRRCEMCGIGFPAHEVEISPCGHLYHIFCLAIRVAMYPACCRQGCREPFPARWMLSYGFPAVRDSETETESVEGTSSSDDDSINGRV